MATEGVAAGAGFSAGPPVRAARAAAVLLAALALWMLASRSAGPTAAERAAERAAFTERTGVRPVHIALTGGGGLIDLRYQVVDADKAAAAHDPARPPALIDTASGELVDKAWMGHSHTSDFRTGTSYFELLINPRHRLERGSEVTLRFGDDKLEHLRVE